jgi:hypothetical protein
LGGFAVLRQKSATQKVPVTKALNTIMTNSENFNWEDGEYKEVLLGERHMFAWVLETYGKFSREDVQSKAISFYKYEDPGTECRGLIFHDLAWHWAMIELYGEGYWHERPELEKPSIEYKQENKKT